MPNPIAAHYLSIDWREPGVARQVTVSSDPIEIEIDVDGAMEAETQIFKDLHPWVGLRLEGTLSDTHPHLVNSDGTWLPWLRIFDNDGREWWVFESGWDNIRNRHYSELHRSFGKFEIAIGQQRLILDNIAPQLDRAGAQEYLEDFRDELVWLAIGKSYGATGEVSISHDKDLVAALSDFSAAARRVLDHPARDIRETTALASTSRVRPNTATFREVLRHPAARRYPGRVAHESADNSENRYMRHMVQVCEGWSRRIAQSALRHGKQFAELAERDQARSAELRNIQTQDVDPEVFETQFNNLKARIDAISDWSSNLPSAKKQTNEYRLQVGEVYGASQNSFFYNREDGSRAEDIERGIRYSVIQLPKELFEIVKAARSVDKKLRLVLHGVAQIKQPKPPGDRRDAIFEEVAHALPFSPMLTRKERRRQQYIDDGWRRVLSKTEREEYRQEARVMSLRAEQSSARAELSKSAARALSAVHEALRRQDAGWSALDVPASFQFPMGMRYVQSPHYAAALAAFRRIGAITEKAGVGEEGVQKVERINILHASALYERWCLIKIISVLVEDLGFRPEADWVKRLVAGVCGRIESFALEFQHVNSQWTARLEVQPKLANGRRPDFRLRFRSSTRCDSLRENWSSGIMGRNKTEQVERIGIVLDAKFRTHWHEGELDRMLSELVTAKEYGQDGDRVFIVQPARKTPRQRTSPLAWGKDCDFGQDSPNSHARGTIRLASGHSSITNLRRLISLQLQSCFSEPAFDDKTGACKSANSFCIRCGSGHFPENVSQRKTRSDKPYWVMSCTECETKIVRTHCFGCKRPLHKNGFQLTYHLTIADQLTNIVCPICGEFFDADIHSEREISAELGRFD